MDSLQWKKKKCLYFLVDEYDFDELDVSFTFSLPW